MNALAPLAAILWGGLATIPVFTAAAFRDWLRDRRQRLDGDRLNAVFRARQRADADHAAAQDFTGRMPSLGMAPGHTWPGDCPACVWWHPAPSEQEDAIAVYQPCPVHDPALWAEMEKRVAQ